MKTRGLVLFFLLGIVFSPNKVFAADPSVFRKILNVDIEYLKSEPGEFAQVRKLMGETQEISQGDASTGKIRLEYVLRDRSQMIAFYVTECTMGYTVERIKATEHLGKTVMSPKINSIEVGGLRLGMDKKVVKEIFSKIVFGKWKVKETKKESKTQSFTYRQTIGEKSGEKYCDQIWIDLEFDKHGKLSKYDVATGGCGEGGCEDE